MLPRAQRSREHFGMLQRRCADIDQVNRWIAQQFVEITCPLDLRHVEPHGIIRIYVPANLGQVSVEAASTLVADRMNARLRNLAVRLDVRRGHEAEPDDADVDRALLRHVKPEVC